MSFYATKIFWFFIQPSSFIVIVLAAAFFFLLIGSLRRCKYLLGTALVCYIIVGLSPVPHLLTVPLEDRFFRPSSSEIKKAGLAGIILLGGGVDTTVSAARKAVTLNEAGDRVVETLLLAKTYPRAKLIVSGAAGQLLFRGVPDADALRHLFTQMLGPSHRIISENKSRNTFENARFSKQIIDQLKHEDSNLDGHWLLVTSAFHMPRAMGCFRKAGVKVLPWPTDYRTRGPQDIWRFFGKPSEGLRRSDIIVREWIGLLVYRILGRTKAILPGPDAK